MLKIMFAALLILAGLNASQAQTVKLVEGSLDALKSQKTIDLQFKYDNMLIGEDTLTDAAYVSQRKAELNKKQQGCGDKWEAEWCGDRKTKYAPAFAELLEKYAKIKIAEASPYTIVFKTMRTEPGWNAGIPIGVAGFMKRHAFIDAEAIVVETGSPERVIAKIVFSRIPGRGGASDSNPNVMIRECYAKSAKEFAKLINGSNR